jgi:DNA-binding HxlR family transcriptional regulator/putative sterol carrier protein
VKGVTVVRAGGPPVKRSYEDGCADAHALDLVGERWALLVIRELLLGPKRFTDLRASLPGISPNVLSQRLHELEQTGVVLRRTLDFPVPIWVYDLTDWGRDLEPVILQLGRWGARSPHRFREAPLSADSLLLSLRAMFDAGAAAGFTASFELRLGRCPYQVVVADGQIEVARGAPERPEAILQADVATLVAVIYDDRDLDEAVKSGELILTGDRSAVERFLTLFHLPDPVS